MAIMQDQGLAVIHTGIADFDLTPNTTDGLIFDTAKTTVTPVVVASAASRVTFGENETQVAENECVAELAIPLMSGGVLIPFAALLTSCGVAQDAVAAFGTATFRALTIDGEANNGLPAGLSNGLTHWTDGSKRDMRQFVSTFKFDFSINQPVIFNFTCSSVFRGGVYSDGVTSATLPAITYPSGLQPVFFATTATITADGVAIPISGGSFDLGNNVARVSNTGQAGFKITGRQPTFSITRKSVGGNASWLQLQSAAKVAIVVDLVPAGGSGVRLSMPVCQIDKTDDADDAGNTRQTISYKVLDALQDDTTFTLGFGL